jgi:co-chaperonin GroES (HSP10)
MIEGKVRPIHDTVLVSDMYFGEVTTKGGIIIQSDDAKAHGVKPRWAKVYAKGPENTDEFSVGDWILIEHGRWTRKVKVKQEDQVLEIQKVENDSILAWSKEQPTDLDYYGEGI